MQDWSGGGEGIVAHLSSVLNGFTAVTGLELIAGRCFFLFLSKGVYKDH
jgi:hypothetical protein